MPNTISVTDETGKDIQLAVMSPAELKAFVEDKSGAGKKASMTYLKALGRPVNEIVKMDSPEREAWILKRYAELGVGGNGTPPKAKAKAGLASKAIGSALPKAKAAPQNAPEDEDEDEDDATPAAKAPVAAAARTVAAPTGGGADLGTLLKEVRAVKELLSNGGLDLTSIHAEVTALRESNEALIAVVQQQEKTLLDMHLIVRVIARAGHELADDDIISFSEECYDKLVVEPASDDDAGND
jgi:hypothetical protein